MPYKLVICEIHNIHIHGFHNINSDSNVKGHYLCRTSYTRYVGCEEDDEYFDWEIGRTREYYNNLLNYGQQYIDHDFIRNYKQIVSNPDYITAEIANVIELRGGEKVAILKTFWLRIVQRAWKRIFKERTIIMAKRNSLYSIRYREINGKWPLNCLNVPGLYGLLVR